VNRKVLALALVACILFGGLALKYLVSGVLWGDWSLVFWAAVAYTGWLTGAIMCVAALAGWRDG